MAHLRSQFVFEPVQLSEHDPVQLTWQVEPPVHDTLPLGPTMTLQVEPPPQSMLHDCAQLPEQMLRSEQLSEQLADPQLDCVKLHVEPCRQLQLAPEHISLSPPPQLANRQIAREISGTIRMKREFITSSAVRPSCDHIAGCNRKWATRIELGRKPALATPTKSSSRRCFHDYAIVCLKTVPLPA